MATPTCSDDARCGVQPGKLAGRPQSQSEPPSRQLAGIVAGLAGATDVGPNAVDRTGGRDADLAHQCRAAAAVASHAPGTVVSELVGDAIEIDIILRGEPWPLA